MDDREAAGGSGETARRKGAKSSNAASKAIGKKAKRPGEKAVRLQLHLPHSVVRRLGVHCSMTDASWSAEAARILEQYLVTHGKGQRAFEEDLEASEPPAE